ncbi:hypothetical protein BAU15_00915 [Enterococcus sp. JM4C]|nr:hypothetical protein BAU15_00915 [Enterococcus sp. JM4C]
MSFRIKKKIDKDLSIYRLKYKYVKYFYRRVPTVKTTAIIIYYHKNPIKRTEIFYFEESELGFSTIGRNIF